VALKRPPCGPCAPGALAWDFGVASGIAHLSRRDALPINAGLVSVCVPFRRAAPFAIGKWSRGLTAVLAHAGHAQAQ
jgi:hypothetical protein